jgi:hypothetical protein
MEVLTISPCSESPGRSENDKSAISSVPCSCSTTRGSWPDARTVQRRRGQSRAQFAVRLEPWVPRHGDATSSRQNRPSAVRRYSPAQSRIVSNHRWRGHRCLIVPAHAISHVRLQGLEPKGARAPTPHIRGALFCLRADRHPRRAGSLRSRTGDVFGASVAWHGLCVSGWATIVHPPRCSPATARSLRGELNFEEWRGDTIRGAEAGTSEEPLSAERRFPVCWRGCFRKSVKSARIFQPLGDMMG